MKEITTVGLDLAKNLFQVHAVDENGAVLVRRQVRRAQVLLFFSRLHPCLIGIEACAGARHWARELAKLGHDVRLIPPSHVKPFVKRGKTDAADAEAICEAVIRPNMRFVPLKTEKQQAVLMQHRARDFLVRQLTQLANAIRAHLGEFGIVVPKGVHNMGRLIAEAETAGLPPEARMPLDLLAGQFRDTKQRIDVMTAQIKADAEVDETARRLQTMPGIGPITASVLAATLPNVSSFRSARDLPAWLGLTPKPHSSGGKERLGSISKMGNRYIRRLLYPGAMGVISARRLSEPSTDWLGRLVATKPLKVAAIALANRMARAIWAMLKTGEAWRPA
ncbi:IS110 family RNA-guided transposase [Paracoccus yeei]|uniref:IS110 family transposase n=1 Tax=Paracoccus yeei TaxID=147645 RepID=A0A2D2C6I2_9RHOB|nr:IS110 family transposase [Paracoccus yeei]ATQ57853.1 IS110 family transposase [Paracoccus yeei]ATQ58113.1 IS110 family transposase [Paracoccus yeei]